MERIPAQLRRFLYVDGIQSNGAIDFGALHYRF